jgi:hypothetical protein
MKNFLLAVAFAADSVVVAENLENHLVDKP